MRSGSRPPSTPCRRDATDGSNREAAWPAPDRQPAGHAAPSVTRAPPPRAGCASRPGAGAESRPPVEVDLNVASVGHCRVWRPPAGRGPPRAGAAGPVRVPDRLLVGPTPRLASAVSGACDRRSCPTPASRGEVDRAGTALSAGPAAPNPDQRTARSSVPVSSCPATSGSASAASSVAVTSSRSAGDGSVWAVVANARSTRSSTRRRRSFDSSRIAEPSKACSAPRKPLSEIGEFAALPPDRTGRGS